LKIDQKSKNPPVSQEGYIYRFNQMVIHKVSKTILAIKAIMPPQILVKRSPIATNPKTGKMRIIERIRNISPKLRKNSFQKFITYCHPS
jgi:hypothetical protein